MSHIQSFSESDRNGGGEDIQQHGTDMQPQASEGIEAANQASSPEPQRSQRARKLTEKGQELHKEQVTRVQHRFIKSNDKWKAVIKDAKGVLSEECPNSLLHEQITKVSDAANDLNDIYEELRRIDIPDPDTRRRIDTCEAVTKTIIETARSYLHTETDEDQGIEKQDSKDRDRESVFKSTASDRSSISHHTKSKSTRSSVHSRSNSKVTSRRSSQYSAHRREAAAEVAANEAALQVLLEKERHIKELEQLEAENAERQRVLEAKRREVERLETVKKLKAAKARQKVYEENECSDDEIDQLLHQPVSLKGKEEIKVESNLSQHNPPPQAMTQLGREDSTEALVRVFAESISASRLPIP